jgi:cytochrome P450
MAQRPSLLDDAKLAANLNLTRLALWRLRRRGDLIARLESATKSDDPYPLYEVVGRQGILTPGKFGIAISASHALASQLLRSPAMGHGARQQDGPPPGAAREDTVHPIHDAFIVMNPPDHTRLRRLVSGAFTPRGLERLRPSIQRISDRLLDRLDGRSGFDLVDSYAAPLPIQVICELLGVPYAERSQFARWGATVGATIDRVTSVRQAHQLDRTVVELNRFFGDLIELRRREPGEDLLSQLLLAEEPLEPRDVMATCLLLFVAGFETTVNLIGNGVLALLRHPEQLERVRERPELAPDLVEEVLRFDAPVQRTGRTVFTEFEAGGTVLPEGQIVLFLLGGANRDPEVFERPREFDVGRPNAREHLAFAAGIHYCLGAALARLEGEVAFRGLVERLPTLELAGPVRRRPSQIIRGPLHLPLRVRRRP